MTSNIANTVTTIFECDDNIYVTLPIVSDEGERAFKSVPVKGIPFNGKFTNGVFFLQLPVDNDYFKKIDILARQSNTYPITPEDYERAAVLIQAGLVNGPISTTAMATQSIASADIIGVLTNNILAKGFRGQCELAKLLRQQGQKLVDTISL
jgi:hypothetical protein